MHEDMTHAHDFGPGHGASFGEHVRWQCTDPFSYVLEVADKQVLDQFVFLEGLSATYGVPFDVPDGFKNILEPFARVSRRATA